MNEKEKLIPQRRFKEFKNTGTWEQRKLGDTFEFSVSTNSLSRAQLNYEKGNIKSIHYGDILIKYNSILEITKDKIPFITDGSIEKYKPNLLENGDVVFADAAEDETVGKAVEINGISDEYVVAGLHTIVARPKEKMAKYFSGYYINADVYQRQLLRLMQGTKVSSISKGNLKKTIVAYPKNLAEQQKIGSFFKQLDNAIALHQRKLEKTKALKSAYLSELFPVEGERKPKRRFAGFIDDWKQGTVGEYGYFYYGKSAPKWSVTKDAIIPCVRYGELYTKFGAKIDKVYSYTNISKENLKFSTGNEVLVPRVGEDPLDFANCSWLSIPNVAIGEMISVYNTEENPLFISYYFNSQLRHAFAKRVEGGNVSNLYFTYLENITISIPNKEEQDTIANFLESLDSVVEHHQHKLEKLKNIKQAYLNELFV